MGKDIGSKRSLKVHKDHIEKVKIALARSDFKTGPVLAEKTGLARSTVSNFVNGKGVDKGNFF